MPGLKSPSSARNFGPILQLLQERLPQPGLVLEIAAGAGEHAMWMAEALPEVTWQPTDRDPIALKLDDMRVALRRREARAVLVERV